MPRYIEILIAVLAVVFQLGVSLARDQLSLIEAQALFLGGAIVLGIVLLRESRRKNRSSWWCLAALFHIVGLVWVVWLMQDWSALPESVKLSLAKRRTEVLSWRRVMAIFGYALMGAICTSAYYAIWFRVPDEWLSELGFSQQMMQFLSLPFRQPDMKLILEIPAYVFINGALVGLIIGALYGFYYPGLMRRRSIIKAALAANEVNTDS